MSKSLEKFIFTAILVVFISACGGDKKEFDQDEPDKWGCSLPGIERVLIAERLVPHLRSHKEKTRQIASNGLMIVLNAKGKIKKKLIDKARKNWPAFMDWYRAERDKVRGAR